MMATQHFVNGFAEYSAYTSTMDEKRGSGGIVNVVFYGRMDAKTGKSWCPDCTTVEPYIQRAFKKAGASLHLIRVDVGDRKEWLNPNNPFRNDKKLTLREIPTIIRWKQPKRLEGVQSIIAHGRVLDDFFTQL
jgi:thiol-disulfide isomerase/thioredoxin